MADRLVIRGAREHNLRDVSLDLPRNRLVVFTGLSGSGKSSLAFDTIYAEGQRRYVESLSSYARQFLGQMDKPDVDFIEGLSPAISIDQKSASRNPRSTVGTVTEIYDYLRLLYARIGRPHCPNCGRPVERQTPQQIVDRILDLPEGTRFSVLAPVVRGRKGQYEGLLEDLAKQGFARVRVDGEAIELAERTTLDLRPAHDRGRSRPADPPRRHPSAADRIDGDRPSPRRWDSGDRHNGRERRGGAGHLLRASRLYALRAVIRRTGPAQLLVQLPVRRLPDV
jgi:excinuclease ABC subunit A